MSDFNKSSAKIAQLIAKICHGKRSSYTYLDKKSGKEVTAYKFECFLLGEQESVYMYGFLKGTEMQVNDAANKFKDGHVFNLVERGHESLLADESKNKFAISCRVVRLVMCEEAEGMVVEEGAVNFLSLYGGVLTLRILLSWFPQAQSVALLQPIFTVSDI